MPCTSRPRVPTLYLQYPGVIRARFFTTSSPVSIGLDYCPGGTLKDYLVGNDLSKQSKLRICTQVASGLTFIHSKSIAHLDLKARAWAYVSVCVCVRVFVCMLLYRRMRWTLRPFAPH